jgi:hypothetical protein
MSDWGWVAFAHGIVYAALIAYAASIAVRTRRVRRLLEDR